MPTPGATSPQTLEQLEQLSTTELLARVLVKLDEAGRYLGGIYGILQEQEGLAGSLGELAPLVMSMMAGATAGQPRTVIEGEIVGR